MMVHVYRHTHTPHPTCPVLYSVYYVNLTESAIDSTVLDYLQGQNLAWSLPPCGESSGPQEPQRQQCHTSHLHIPKGRWGEVGAHNWCPGPALTFPLFTLQPLPDGGHTLWQTRLSHGTAVA
jgi:hypothetical protein